jgi:3-methyladenine DNA glycosylase AlkD
MILSNAAHAREFGRRLANECTFSKVTEAYAFLAPVLAERTPFRLLDLVGEATADYPFPKLDPFLDEIASHASIGGWTVIASALRSEIPTDIKGTLERTRAYIIQADVWYACDCFGERVLGQALVDQFDSGLALLSLWRTDANRWVRRSIGVGGHLWAKRANGLGEYNAQALQLLDFYRPMLNERQFDAAKGVGWAIKTLGRYFPQEVYGFLVKNRSVRVTPIVMRKALTYLPNQIKSRLTKQE